MLKLIASVTGLLLATCATAEAASSDAAKDLAPSGRLRAAINFGNPVLAQKDPVTGAPGGVSVALARELGRQLGIPVDLVPFTEAGQVFEALKADAWDVAFLAVDPVRAAGIDFTAPYVLIEGTYLVPMGSPFHQVDQVDRQGTRIGVAKDSAYDLFLTRSLKHAEIVRAANSAAATALLEQQQVDALAGVRQPLAGYAKSHADVRVMPGRFMEIAQAMGAPKGREAGFRFLRAFVEDMKESGFVAKALGASGQSDATVAPAAP
ncbi:MAG TPA: ABC transporter substrate-binding protein [Aliidongia sp.]|uniref:ABC transporter substrate-binding protein n=1 Tax=Aliidongia sp. TaxID=1914230 RepID=UPI002DDCDCF8|nr:ABC transporter substrate-binding protein [Aliidongia sp.]HEV2678216.1 ABC transporter substrate-binding protein [Aliidongia sp.]